MTSALVHSFRALPAHWLLPLLLCLALAGRPAPALAAGAEDAAFLQAVTDYHEGRFDRAAALFEAQAAAGVRSGALFYNLGNAWLKVNDMGRAVLWYERALAFTPADPDLRFNLDYARSQLKDAYEPDDSVAAAIFFFWKDILARSAIQYAALAANAAFWLGLAWLRLRRGKAAKIVCGLALLGLALFAPTALHQQYEDAADPKAVVLASEAAVRSGLSDNATELFTLHAGSKTRVEERKPGYARIRFGKDKIGWIKDSQIEII